MNNYVNSLSNCIIPDMIKQASDNNKFLIECSVYPNPIAENGFIDVTLHNPTDILLEITNAIGQVFSKVTYKNLHTGKNTITIEASNLNVGLYFYTIKAGEEKITKMMSVE